MSALTVKRWRILAAQALDAATSSDWKGHPDFAMTILCNYIDQAYEKGREDVLREVGRSQVKDPTHGP